MQSLKVQCPNCKQIRHETTEHYQPDQTPKGDFVRLVDPWKKWRWSDFDDQGQAISTTMCSMMTCPGCAAPLAPKGRLTIFTEPEKPKTQAEINQEKMDILFEEASLEAETGVWIEDEPQNDLICKICGKVCKSKAGLGAHKRSHL